MAVITISRQYGSGGDEIAALLCRRLGYRLFDKYLITQAAVESGLSEREVVDLSEDSYQLQGFFDRLFNRTRQVAQLWAWANENPVYFEMPAAEETAIALVRRAILKAYQLGNFVIIGRGGQVVLQDHPDVFHVRVEAPIEARIQTVREQLTAGESEDLAAIEARRQAQDLITTRDEASADYLRRFYGVNWADPTLYHILINTGRVSRGWAARIIADLAMQRREEAVAP